MKKVYLCIAMLLIILLITGCFCSKETIRKKIQKARDESGGGGYETIGPNPGSGSSGGGYGGLAQKIKEAACKATANTFVQKCVSDVLASASYKKHCTGACDQKCVADVCKEEIYDIAYNKCMNALS